MPRTTRPTQRALPTAAPAGVANSQPRTSSFKPSAPPARVVNQPARAANFAAPRVARMTMSQAGSQLSLKSPTLTRVTATTTACCCPVCLGLQCLDRTRYFAGQLLSEADLNNEQSYWLAKQRLHNRYLVGWGVVCGLQVVCGECAGWVTVNPGYAIDPCGNDVIVCQSQNFNVLQAIQQCCAPAAQPTANCSPLRYNPSPTCKNSKQEWCITIQYQEQSTNLVTPLSNSISQSSSACSCSSGNGSSSKSSQSSSNTTTTGSCSATSSQSTTIATIPTGACEATRIVEGFQLGVVPATQVESAIKAGNPNSLLSQVTACLTAAATLRMKAPTFDANTTSASAYQATCNYLGVVQQYFATADDVTMCTILTLVSAITVATGQDVSVYLGIVSHLKVLIADALLNCICLAIVPPCPAPACDNRIVLACVTVENGAITNICHFPGRNQLVTLQTLGYWLGILGLDKVGSTLSEIFALLCCTSDKDVNRTGLFDANNLFYNEAITTAGITSGADINRIAAHYLAQNVGAQVMNTFNPSAQALDLRTLVNQPLETVQENLRQQGVKSMTLQPVDNDPAWDAQAVSASAQFAPAAVGVSQPIVIYTQGQVAVGFDVIDPTTAKLNDLQNQITALQEHLNPAQKPLAAPPAQNPPGAAPKKNTTP